MKTKTISIVNGKGGSGKTTLSVAMSMVLSEDYKVLLIDIDPQCSSSLATECYKNGKDMAKVFMGDSIENNIHNLPNFDIVPGSVKMSNFGTLPETSLKRELKQIVNSEKYDFIIIDSQGAVTNLMRMAISAADSIIVPTKLNIVDFDTAIQTIEEIEKMDFQGDVGIVLNGIKDRTQKWTQEKINQFTENETLGPFVLNTQISEMVSLEKALSVENYKIPHAAKSIIKELILEVLA